MTFSHSRYNPQIKLSPEELLEISQEINREFAPNFSTAIPSPGYHPKISAKEMFEISEEIRQDFAPRASNNTLGLVLLPVDPDHLYAYWSLDDDKLNGIQKYDSTNQLTLRIFPVSIKNKAITNTKSWFDVAIDSTQAQQSVFLSMRAHETAYSATIGKRYPDNSLAPFAYSSITYVPIRKIISHQAKESKVIFEPLPQGSTANRETFIYTNYSASGQGNNE